MNDRLDPGIWEVTRLTRAGRLIEGNRTAATDAAPTKRPIFHPLAGDN
jgi:hypothetical protein